MHYSVIPLDVVSFSLARVRHFSDWFFFLLSVLTSRLSSSMLTLLLIVYCVRYRLQLPRFAYLNCDTTHINSHCNKMQTIWFVWAENSQVFWTHYSFRLITSHEDVFFFFCRKENIFDIVKFQAMTLLSFLLFFCFYFKCQPKFIMVKRIHKRKENSN